MSTKRSERPGDDPASGSGDRVAPRLCFIERLGDGDAGARRKLARTDDVPARRDEQGAPSRDLLRRQRVDAVDALGKSVAYVIFVEAHQ